MTRKDYELIAKEIKKRLDSDCNLDEEQNHKTLKILSVELGNALQRENPKFDFAIFIRACGF